jgi:hypothetical protein
VSKVLFGRIAGELRDPAAHVADGKHGLANVMVGMVAGNERVERLQPVR